MSLRTNTYFVADYVNKEQLPLLGNYLNISSVLVIFWHIWV